MDGEGATTAAAAMDCSSCNTTSGIEAPATASEQQQEAALPTKRKRPGGDGDEGGDGDGGGDNNGDGNGAQLQPKPKQRPQQQKPPKQKQGQKQKQRRQQQQRAPRPEFPPIEVEYRIEGGLRHVVPYVYAFTARAKGRWWGRPVLEVFQKEFRTYNPAYYEASILAGTITVNGHKVEPTYLLKNNDLLLHKCHRHEPPVSGESPLPIIAEDAGCVVVSKPATIPVHPCGAYRFNSVLHILQRERPDLFAAAASAAPSNALAVEGKQAEEEGEAAAPTAANANANGSDNGGPHGATGLHVIYRLDRLTSGLLILARSPEGANKKCQELQSGRTKKYYLALVRGDFASLAFAAPKAPEGAEGEEVLFDAWCTTAGEEEGEGDEEGAGAAQDKGGKKKGEEEGDGAVAPAPMHWRVQSDGSVDARAGIRCVSYRDAVYECSPQGKPSRTLFRVLGFDGERSLVACRPITGRTHQIRNHLQWLGFPIANDPNYGDAATVAAFKGQWGKQTEAYAELSTTYDANPAALLEADDPPLPEAERIRRLCPYCQHGDAVMFKGEQLHHKGIYLHAWRYEGRAGWAYQTPYPEWAQGFVKEGGEGDGGKEG